VCSQGINLNFWFLLKTWGLPNSNKPESTTPILKFEIKELQALLIENL
jgi:hypothetical protein